MAVKSIGRTVILAHDPAAALRWYEETFGFVTLYNDGVFFHAGPPGQPGVGLWFLKAEGEAQAALVGQQTGGQPVLVLYVDDCRATHADLLAKGVRFAGEPQASPGDVHVHCYDLYGNRIVLVELKR